MALPTLDMSLHTNGDLRQQQKFRKELLESLQAHGFAKIVNHSLDRKTMDTLMSWCRQFFKISQAEKRSIQNEKGPNPQRGYSGIGGENLDVFALDGTKQKFVDVKEHFDQGPRDDRMYPNVWPKETSRTDGIDLIGFRDFMESYFDTASALSNQLLAILETGLQVKSATLTSCCDRGDNELRLNYYPPTTEEALKTGGVRRSGAHTDYGILTLLVQDTRGGLQIQDRSQISPSDFDSAPVKFVPVGADDPYALIMNVGDTLQQWTNDLIPAGLHQVLAPEKRAGSEDMKGHLPERYSVAFFQKANRDESIGSKAEFISEKRPARYEHLSAIDYHKQRHTLLYT